MAKFWSIAYLTPDSNPSTLNFGFHLHFLSSVIPKPVHHVHDE